MVSSVGVVPTVVSSDTNIVDSVATDAVENAIPPAAAVVAPSSVNCSLTLAIVATAVLKSSTAAAIASVNAVTAAAVASCADDTLLFSEASSLASQVKSSDDTVFKTSTI